MVLCQEGARAPCFVWLNAALLAAAAFAALRVPQLLPAEDAARPAMVKGGVGALLRLPLYRRVVLVAALILGSHAMHDSFAVIRWGAAGIGPGTAGLLWSLSVAAEVIVFLFVGRPLLDRLAPAGAAISPLPPESCAGRCWPRPSGSRLLR